MRGHLSLTIIINLFGKRARIRLIGVDTPETKHPKKPFEHYEREAYHFTKNLCEGKRVRVEHDSTNKYIKHRDKYGRLLAYVFFTDGTVVNAEIVKQGSGHAYTKFAFKYLDEFGKYEKEARQEG